MRSDRSKRSGFMIEASVYPRDRMTREEQMQCIVDNVDAFEKTLLAKASKIPPNWDGMEIRQWVMDCPKDAWVSKTDKTRMHRHRVARQLYGL